MHNATQTQPSPLTVLLQLNFCYQVQMTVVSPDAHPSSYSSVATTLYPTLVYIILYIIILYIIILYYILYYITLHYITLYYIENYIILYYIILYYVIRTLSVLLFLSPLISSGK